MEYKEGRAHARGVYSTQHTSRMGDSKGEVRETDTIIIAGE